MAHSSDEETLPDGPMMVADDRGDLRSSQGGRGPGRTVWLKKCCASLKSISKKCWEHKNARLLIALLLGQFLSVLLCGTGVTSQLLASKHSVTVPTTQTFLTYVLLGAVYGGHMATKGDFLTILRKNWWKYVILGVVDLEANYLVVMAYRYTSLTTVQLLDSFTIAAVMVLSFVFLRARYKIINFMGVALSLVGILSLVLADYQGSRAGKGSNPLLGDVLCLGGSLLYAVSNVAQEFLVKNHSITEYLGFIGVTGSIASAIQLLVLEREDLARMEWDLYTGLLFLGFGASQFLFYSIVPHLLKMTSAVLFNLSLLTADIYTLLFGLYLFHYKFSFFYVFSFILIVTGVFIYNLRQPSTAEKKQSKKRDGEEEEGGRGKIVSGLRRALFESQTYEMSESKEEQSGRVSSSSPAGRREPAKGLLSKLAAKLLSKLPRLPPTPADHSALASSSRRRFEGLAQEDDAQDGNGFLGASKESLISEEERAESSGPEGTYGSVMPTGTKRTRLRTNSSSSSSSWSHKSKPHQ